MTERRTRSIYGCFRTGHTPETMHRLLADPELDLSLKFTAVLAAYAYLPERVPAPLRLRDFRSLIPDAFWEEHFAFGWSKYGGWVNTECGQDEWHYGLGLGQRSSPHGVHSVNFVSRLDQLCIPQGPSGTFHPSLDAEVVRFTLNQPFMQSEMHEGTDIYVFTGA